MKTPPRPILQALALACGLASLAAAPAHAATIYGLTADRQVSSTGAVTDVNPMLAGYSGSTGLNAVFVFQLPALPAGKAFANVSARIYHQGKTGTPNFNADLYGLGSSSSPTVNASDFYAGPLDTSTLLLHENLLTPSSGAGGKVASGAVLTDYLNLAYAGGSGAGHYVFLRVSPDVAGLNNYTRYNFYSAETTLGTFYQPSLTYDVVDAPPAWVSVPLGGGGYVTGIVSDPTGADIYIRTDVGGAFRWVESAGAWLSITDTIVPTTTPGAQTLMNTAAIAVDPSNSNNLYVAAGSPVSGSLRGIYASTDGGATWTAIETTIAMDGNGAFRAFGERLAVDPNNSNVLWFGSHAQGLWKGVKSGGSWTWSQIPSGSVPFGQVASGDKAGVVFVACDPNGGSTITYAGVYDSVGSSGGVYRSTNGGSTWAKVAGATLAKPARGQVAPDGTLYVTANGVVAKMPRAGSFSAITPLAGVNYRGVATDPNDSTGNTLYVAEANGAAQYNKIWRSTNGGSTWAQQHQNLNDGLTIPRTEPDGTPSITGYWFGNITSLLVNPADSAELWACDFFGVARTQNAGKLGGSGAGNQAIWYMLQKNQDETVVETLKNAPTGAALMAGVADVGGFRYDDLSERPQGAAGNNFSNPTGANSNSLDFSEGNPDHWVRSWTSNTLISGSSYYGGGATSRDGGVTWLSFGEIDRRTVSSGTAGWETWDLTTYLAARKARGATVVTLVLAAGPATNDSTTQLMFDSLEATDPALRPRLVINGSTTLITTADALVSGYSGASNYGSWDTVRVSYAWGNVSNEKHTYLKFDLTGAPSSITSAELRLHRVADTAGIDRPVGVYACSDTSWSQSTITWNNRPPPYASSAGRPINHHRYQTATGLNPSGGRVAISATNSDRLVWMPFGGGTMPLYSEERGVLWRPTAGLPANVNRLISKANPSYVLNQLASDRVNGNFYIAHFAASGGAHHIYRSTDGGANWSQVGAIPFTGGSYNIYRCQIVAAPAAGHVWVCDDGVSGTTNGGLWKSTDSAATWSTRLANIRAVRQVAFGKPPSGSSYDYSVFINGYYNGVKGVYRSDNYGSTWTAIPDLPTNADIESLAGDRQIHGGLFIGTHGRGIMHYQP